MWDRGVVRGDRGIGGTAVRMNLAAEAGPKTVDYYNHLTPYDLPYEYISGLHGQSRALEDGHSR